MKDNSSYWREFVDEASGYPCVIRRLPLGGSHLSSGRWCAYVGVDPNHPILDHGDDVPDWIHSNVRGGVTFVGSLGSEFDERVWVGMDFSHSFDFDRNFDPIHHSESFVCAEVKRLAHTLMVGRYGEGAPYLDLPECPDGRFAPGFVKAVTSREGDREFFVLMKGEGQTVRFEGRNWFAT